MNGIPYVVPADPLGLMRPKPLTPVTFGQFTREAKKHGFGTAEVAAAMRPWWETGESRLPGASESKTEFAERLFSAQYAGNVVVYRPLLLLYQSWRERPAVKVSVRAQPARQGGKCLCGCGRTVLGRKQFASDTCSKRYRRRAVKEALAGPSDGVRRAA